MADYTPAYPRTLPFTSPRYAEQLDGLQAMITYAVQHDDLPMLDEVFCKIISVEHQVLRWNQQGEQLPHVRDALKILDRALKWAWLAREEEDHMNGVYASKLKEAIAVLEELQVRLARREDEHEVAPASVSSVGMTREKAEALKSMIKRRLPQAEVELKEGEGGWMVEARYPRRGASQMFRSSEQFEELMRGTQQSTRG